MCHSVTGYELGVQTAGAHLPLEGSILHRAEGGVKRYRGGLL